MQQKTLLHKVTIKSNFKKNLASEIFDSLLDEIKKAILRRESISIDELGTFIVNHRESKTVTDINKKSVVLLPPKDKITFLPSENLLNFLKD